MSRNIPENLIYFLKNGIQCFDNTNEFSNELHRILSQDDCQKSLNSREIEVLRDFAEKVKKIEDIDYYTEEKIKNVELELFGTRGVLGFLKVKENVIIKPVWPF